MRPGPTRDMGQALSRRDDIVRRWRSTSGRGRKLRGLLELLRPYRGRTALMFLTRKPAESKVVGL